MDPMFFYLFVVLTLPLSLGAFVGLAALEVAELPFTFRRRKLRLFLRWVAVGAYLSVFVNTAAFMLLLEVP